MWQANTLYMDTFNDMQLVKRRLFAMRNGIIADVLRRGGSPFRIIFGVNLPQLAEIADGFGYNADLAERLWQNSTTRESMLIAPMLYPRDEFTVELARRWVSEVPSAEVADVLCHRLLRHCPFAWELASELLGEESDMARYTGLRLMFNMLYQRPAETLEKAEKELARDCSLTSPVAAMMVAECRELL